jgi:tetratricopeptide (TPR) repeat protein
MNCINCGSPITEESYICPFCGTSNDVDLLKKYPARSSDTHIDEAHAFGKGNIDEISMEKSLQIMWWKIHIGERIYWKNIIKDKIMTVLTVIFIICSIIFMFSVYQSVEKRNKAVYYNEALSKFKKGSFTYYRGKFTDRSKDHGSLYYFDNSMSWALNNEKAYYLSAVAHYYDYLNVRAAISNLTYEQDRILTDFISMRENLNKAIKSNYNSPGAHYYMGLYYVEENKYRDAMTEFNRCITIANSLWPYANKNKDKWIRAANIMIKELSIVMGDKNNKHYIRMIPPVLSEPNEFLTLIKYNNGKGTIMVQNKVLVKDQICPPVPDEVE